MWGYLLDQLPVLWPKENHYSFMSFSCSFDPWKTSLQCNLQLFYKITKVKMKPLLWFLNIPPSFSCCPLVSYLFQSLSCVWLFVTPWTVACQASLSITNFLSLLRLISIKSVKPSNHLILCYPLLPHLQSFPASGSFPMSQFFTSGGQSIGASASVHP